jgi:hypothetical protein
MGVGETYRVRFDVFTSTGVRTVLISPTIGGGWESFSRVSAVVFRFYDRCPVYDGR